MSKAFDSLYLSLLVNKLTAHGFSTNSLALSDHISQIGKTVLISQETTSSWYTAIRGCPQGSAFGPLLKNVFQNDPHLSTDKNRLLYVYVDEHHLFSVARTTNRLS